MKASSRRTRSWARAAQVPCPGLKLLSFIKLSTCACHNRDHVPETAVGGADYNAVSQRPPAPPMPRALWTLCFVCHFSLSLWTHSQTVPSVICRSTLAHPLLLPCVCECACVCMACMCAWVHARVHGWERVAFEAGNALQSTLCICCVSVKEWVSELVCAVCIRVSVSQCHVCASQCVSQCVRVCMWETHKTDIHWVLSIT